MKQVKDETAERERERDNETRGPGATPLTWVTKPITDQIYLALYGIKYKNF